MKKVLYRQGYHLLGYLVLGTILSYSTMLLPVGADKLLGMSAIEWLLFSWVSVFVFHAWILVFWRLELYYGFIRNWMGSGGFIIHKIGYSLFGILSLAPIIPISILTRNTIPIPESISIPILVISVPFVLWSLYSATFYFGLSRASGADHFDPSYRTIKIERRGIYKYISNSMYTVLLLALYHPGIHFESSLGLVTAAAHHIFVWFHYYCTEKPDMEEIYGD